MTDTWNLNWTSADGLKVAVDNLEEYTIVSVERSLPGQFEQTQNTTESGTWLEPPQLQQAGDRAVVTIRATHGRFEIEIEGLNVEVQAEESSTPPMLPIMSIPSESDHLGLPQAAICQKCGHVCQPDDRFCAQCGAPL